MALAWLSVLCMVALMIGVGNARWVLSWSDEFDGPTVDPTHWNVYNNWTQLSNQVEVYIERNVFTENGVLVLKTTREPYTLNGRLYNYTSGRVDSANKFSQKYGRWEVRATLPNPYASGVHPAHWLLGYECWPKGGEIDIMEQTEDYTSIHTTSTLHFGEECGKDLSHIKPSSFPPVNAGSTAVNFTSTYHVFAVEWTATTLDFFVDTNHTLSLHAGTNATVPQWDMFLILSSAVMRAQRWEQPDWVWPVRHAIDYVRVYEWDGSTADRHGWHHAEESRGAGDEARIRNGERVTV